MPFHDSHFFLGFLPAALAVYGLAGRFGPQAARAAALLTLSVVFYAAAEGWGTVALAASVALNYGLARRQAPVAIGILLNLGLLTWFKLAAAGPGSEGVLLAVSFFTFQQIAFLVDAQRGDAKPEGIGQYALFVAFFPHLVAGPIVRFHELAPQLRKLHPLAVTSISPGLTLFAIGLAKKVVVADQLAPFIAEVDAAAKAGDPLTFVDAWLANLLFGLRLYFDFSGYSDMAVGLARLFGIELPRNFAAPYQAGSFRDFWRRWHITLSTFFRDYLYLPLKGRLGAASAALLTMTLAGVWHGIGVTFLIWGAAHGVLVAAEHLAGKPRPRAWARPFVFLVVTSLWSLFRAEDLTVARRLLAAMVDVTHPAALTFKYMGNASTALGAALILVGVVNLPSRLTLVGDGSVPRLSPWTALGAGLMIAASVVMTSKATTFIYFRF